MTSKRWNEIVKYYMNLFYKCLILCREIIYKSVHKLIFKRLLEKLNSTIIMEYFNIITFNYIFSSFDIRILFQITISQNEIYMKNLVLFLTTKNVFFVIILAYNNVLKNIVYKDNLWKYDRI